MFQWGISDFQSGGGVKLHCPPYRGQPCALVLVVFVMVVFVMVVFVIAHCRNMHNIAPNGATAAEALFSSSVVAHEGSPEDWWCYSLFQSKE